jgi:hypothetical protein
VAKTLLEMRLAYQKKMREKRKESRKKKNKFNAQLVRDSSGRSIHSLLEMSVGKLYELRERAGEIKILGRQDKHTFHWNGVKIISYIPDFKLQDLRTGEIFWGEAKGFKDALWSVKEACWRAAGPGRLEMWEGDAARPVFTGNIIPKGP